MNNDFFKSNIFRNICIQILIQQSAFHKPNNYTNLSSNMARSLVCILHKVIYLENILKRFILLNHVYGII